MTAAYRLKGIGWFALVVAVALSFYLVSLRVAAERKKLDGMNGRIALAQREIRALETEFDTRANLAQLERWNGDTLALAAPTAQQFVRGDAALAALDPQAMGAPPAAGVKAAALVVPSMPEAPPAPELAEAARGAIAVAVAEARPRAVAMLDRKLLSDTTFGDLMARARTEAGAR